MPSDLGNLSSLHPLEKKGEKCDIQFEAAAPKPEMLDQMLRDNSQKFIFAIIQVRV